jgi:hypothetical protein
MGKPFDGDGNDIASGSIQTDIRSIPIGFAEPIA